MKNVFICGAHFQKVFPIANYFVVFTVQGNSFRCPLCDNFFISLVSFCSG